MTLCDIGNTTFAFFQKKKKFKVGVDAKIKDLPTLKDDIYFISVNGKATKRFLKKYPNAINIENLLNFNTKYHGMGIDRKVASYYVSNAIVVDCGSAITVDIMKNGKHKGGFILCGLKNLANFYPQISQKLNFKFIKDVNLDKMPLNTNDAISYAILKSIILPIKDCENKYNLDVYFTGEDSKYLIKHFRKKSAKDNKSKYKKNLIFNAMKKIIKDGRKVC